MSRDFNKAKIYKITNDYNDDIYIGSTCDTLIKRFIKHKSKSKIENSILYQKMRDIGVERFRIELIEDYPCEDKYQLLQRESFWIREIGSINQRVSYLSIEEKKFNKTIYNQMYNETYNEERKTYKKELYNKQIQEMLCSCGSKLRGINSNLQKHFATKKHQNYFTNNDYIIPEFPL